MVSQVAHPSHTAPVDTTNTSKANVDVSSVPFPQEKEVVWEEPVKAPSFWHLQNHWGLFAWIEFGLKIIGSFTGFIALTSIGTTLQLSVVRIIEIILFALLSLGLLVPLIAAYAIKESFDFVYVVITFLAHVAVIFVLLFGTTGMDLVVFCAMMAVGESFRLVFLEATPARKLPPTLTVGRRRALIGFVFFYIGVYLAVATIETITVINDNTETIVSPTSIV